MAKKKSAWDKFAEQGRDLIEKAGQAIADEIQRLQIEYHRVTGRPHGGNSTTRRDTTFGTHKRLNIGKAKWSKKRVRRSPDDLKKTASNVVAFVKQKGEAKPKEITAKFGLLLPSPKEFVKRHGGVALKVKGSRSTTVYHL